MLCQIQHSDNGKKWEVFVRGKKLRRFLRAIPIYRQDERLIFKKSKVKTRNSIPKD